VVFPSDTRRNFPPIADIADIAADFEMEKLAI
jgi:hypothetical protein